ncbi:GNAT family N-acetyltransferase [Hoeflea sp. TYP-13]|uniref:GNAT family N-acetyltransferase n=1 Tax=Hoeflea sp. TYP-13 TaxID=3230023 RepID=UPI0034C5E17F
MAKQNNHIRRATAHDLERIIDCAHAAYEIYVSRIGRAPAPMIADFEEQIRQHKVFVHSDTVQVIRGYVVFYKSGRSVLLENVAVHPDHHGMGYGRQLVSFVEEYARNEGMDTVRLYTNIHMHENLSLYPALGYRETGRRREDGFERVYFEKAVDR